jgi:hypothetical protein
MLGVNEIKDILKLSASIGNAFAKSMEGDNEINSGDMGNFVEPLLQIGPALQGAGQIVPQMADLTKEEIDELVLYGVSELKIPQEDVMQVIESSLKVVAEIGKVVLVFVKPAAAPQA